MNKGTQTDTETRGWTRVAIVVAVVSLILTFLLYNHFADDTHDISSEILHLFFNIFVSLVKNG